MFGQNKLAPLAHGVDGQSLEVNSIFYTIQGEGPHAGCPAVFVRLAKCNLRCHFCFGWFPNTGRQPFVYMATGPKKKLGEVVAGDRLITLDKRGQLQETIVQKVLRRKVDEWMRVKIEGTLYYMTLDHPMFTNRGLVVAKNIRAGDEILHCEPRDVISWKKLGDKNPMKDSEVAARSRSNTSYAEVGRKIAATLKKKKKKGTYIHAFAPLNKKEHAQMRGKISVANTREGNGMFNADCANRNFYDLKAKVKKNGALCERCQRPGRDVHHRDHNKNNDARENFEVLCHSCHSTEHRVGYNFHKKRPALVVQNGKLVQSVTYVNRMEQPPSLRVRALPTVNLSCAPYPTYLADGMWAKNCDTEFERSSTVPIAEIVDRVNAAKKDGSTDLVVLTGGEPMRQQLIPLLRALDDAGFHTQIETAGTCWPPGLEPLLKSRVPSVELVCSPKTGKVHPNIERYCQHYKYIIRAGEISPVDGLPTRSTQVKGRTISLYAPDPDNVLPTIWVQPCCEYIKNPPAEAPLEDCVDHEATARNMQECARIAMLYGYRVSLQIHKILNLE